MKAKLFAMCVALLVIGVLPAGAATPTVDGEDTGDWAGVGLSATDPNEPDVNEDGDIHFVYLTCDSSNIYLRFDPYAAPVAWEINGSEGFQAYFDTDPIQGTGCDATVNHNGTGYDRRIQVNLEFGVARTQECVSGSWTGSGTGVQVAGGSILEVSAPLGVGTMLGDFCNTPIDFFIYFDDGTLQGEDLIPDSGSETLVELASFTARPFGSAVQVGWVSASEIDNAGFNLYRKTEHEADWTKVNATLIPATGGPTFSAEYELVDDAVRGGVKYYYLLEDLDVHGVSATHGPVWVVLPLQSGGAALVE